jgi:hypothetical protein
MAENSETVRGRGRRRRRRGGRRFVVPRPGATLSHLVIIRYSNKIIPYPNEHPTPNIE